MSLIVLVDHSLLDNHTNKKNQKHNNFDKIVYNHVYVVIKLIIINRELYFENKNQMTFIVNDAIYIATVQLPCQILTCITCIDSIFYIVLQHISYTLK